MKKHNRPSVGVFVHTVFFWFKEPDNEKNREVFEVSLGKFITNSDYVKTAHIGTPAPTNRPVIDSSYTYCYVATFNTKEDQDAYQSEPAHLVFVEECKDFWAKVQVYDSIELK